MNKKVARESLDRFFHASMAAICHCYDNTDGFYPDECSCDKRQEIAQSMSLLTEEYKILIRALDL